jgi:hypothetical protein
VTGYVTQNPGSADGESEEEHRKDSQAGLRRVEVFEGIRGDCTRVVSHDIGKRPDGVNVRALLPLELSTGFNDASDFI